MLRWLYRRVVHLHPPGFRNRFGEGMLSIFDQQSGRTAALGMLSDCILSLLRQWILRPHFWPQISVHPGLQAIPDGVPSFSTLDTFRPRTFAVIHGLVLSAVLFCLTCIAIRYSWIRVLHVQIRESSFDPYLQLHPNSSPGDLRGRATSASQQTVPVGFSEKTNLISERLQVDVLPVEPVAPTLISDVEKSGLPGAFSSTVTLGAGNTIQLPLEPYVGDYISKSPKLKISITIRHGQLSMELANQPRRSLSPVSQTLFVDERNGGWIKFVPDKRGMIRALELAQNGQMVTAHRQ